MAISASYPNLRPTLSLDFANSGRMDPRVTFTRASTATYFDETGVLQSAAIDAPRFDYDPATLAARGLLIEEARTNSIIRSQDFSTGWVVSQCTVTAAAGTAPDGTNSAGKLVLNNGASVASSRAAYQDIAGITGVQTVSIFAKAVEFNVLRISGRAADASTLSGPDFTLTGSGTVGALGNATSASITPVGNGWYRCVATFDFLTGATAARSYYASSQATGDGTSGILIWGAQLEAGAFPTSYIPTTTTSLTRSADVASVNTLSPWFNANEGTLYGEVSSAAITVGGASRRIANINDGTEADRITVGWAGATLVGAAFVSDGGVTQAGFNSPSGAYPFPTKVALAYKAADFQAAVNGSAFATVSSGTVPTVNRMTIGDVVTGGTGPQNLNGHIRRITFYPRRLSQAELTAITT